MASQKFNILYGRLSQEDDRAGDSNSIVNQRLLLERYAQTNGFENTIFLADDGYSGTNFDRPSWKKVIEMIERDEVETLIVKDMSRLGREYLQVGQLTELYLPAKGVRFIAINDGVDSLVESSTDFNPIRNWANELHAKESSKKVRAVKKLQAERGERLGGRPPYGYRKRSNDTKEIVPDEDTAPIVQRIFELCASGKGPNQIARILTDEKVLNPSNYYYQKYGTSHRHLDTTRPYSWSGSTVTGILDNKVYLGHMPGLRNTSISYKNKKHILRPESEQVLVENTHKALVTQEQWDIVQTVRQHKKRTPKQMDEPNMFSGLVYCADCGKPLVLHRASTMKKTKYNFQCYTFGKRGKGNCSPHHIREIDLMKIVLDDIRRVTHSARTQERQFAQYINQKNSVELRREMNVLQKELDTMRKRNSEISLLFKRLYEDHVLGRVTAEQFRMLSSDYNAEQKALEDAIPEKEARLEKLRASAANVDTFIEKAKRYTAIDELTPELLRLFIQRIEVGERSKKYSRSAAQSVRIIYRDIGSMDRPMEPKVLQPHDTPEVSNPIQIPA
jgi:site-specific DNA recombinase